MRHNVNEKVLKKGIEEIFKKNINNAEKELATRLEESKNETDKKVFDYSFKNLYDVKERYLSLVSAVSHYLDKNKIKKYEAEIDNMIDEKIRELKNYMDSK
ncbi:MAG: hypothetical protein ABIE36_00140 [Candidatus Diapherotrites archaeon]